MTPLTDAFVKFLSALKSKDAAVDAAAREVMMRYVDDPPAAEDNHDAAVRTLIDKADAETAFELLARLILMTSQRMGGMGTTALENVGGS